MVNVCLHGDWVCVLRSRNSKWRAKKELGCRLLLPYSTHGETEAHGHGATPSDPDGESHVPSSFDLCPNHAVQKGWFMFMVSLLLRSPRNDLRKATFFFFLF